LIRLILIDVDGTLVGRDGVHASSAGALARARERGVHLGLCTGRIGNGLALEYAREVSPDGLHIFQSGAVISRPGAPAERARRLTPESYRALVAISRREREPLEVYSETRFFLERHTPLTRVHAHHLEMEPELVEPDAIPEPAVRAQWVVPERDWPRFRELTLAIPDLEVNPATAPWSPGTIFSNVTRAGTSKASALLWLAAHLGLTPGEVAMVGDGENDLDALEAAGLALVMGGAPARVRAVADRVVAEADAGGLAEAIAIALG
jgi:Cof subfamily protein (haloacid dehalogenase superfamily)